MTEFKRMGIVSFPAPFRRLIQLAFFYASLPIRGMTLGVRVLVLNDAGQVLLVRHGYTPGWYLPGGGVDRFETAEEAARRELDEETGFQAEGEGTLIGFYYNLKAWKGDHVALFRFPKAAQKRPFSPGAEIKEIGWFDCDNLPADAVESTRKRLAEVLQGAPQSAYWS